MLSFLRQRQHHNSILLDRDAPSLLLTIKLSDPVRHALLLFRSHTGSSLLAIIRASCWRPCLVFALSGSLPLASGLSLLSDQFSLHDAAFLTLVNGRMLCVLYTRFNTLPRSLNILLLACICMCLSCIAYNYTCTSYNYYRRIVSKCNKKLYGAIHILCACNKCNLNTYITSVVLKL